MIKGRLVNIDGGTLVARAYRAEGFFERLRGLLGRPPLTADEALVLQPCNAVHTFGMRYAIDVVFLDRAGSVTKVANAVVPYRYTQCLSARTTVELAGGVAAALSLQPGTTIEWRP